MKTSVIIPTYFNCKKLERCLVSLTNQSLIPNEVLILFHQEDVGTGVLLSEFAKRADFRILPFSLGRMKKMTEILNIGIRNANGEIICFLDEDIVVSSDWLAKLTQCFNDEKVIACGGKDVICISGREVHFPPTEEVGILKWKGCIVGNQHRGIKRKNVMFLKGCNMAVRGDYLKYLDTNLIGLIRWEQDIFFHLLPMGKRVVYDPNIEVCHLKDSLTFLSPKQTFCYGHNTLYLFLKYLRGRDKTLAFLFTLAIGDVSSPGLIRLPFWLIKRNEMGICAFATAQIGKIKAIFTYLDKYCRKGRC